MLGQELRFFSKKVFGAWVDARVVAVAGGLARLRANFFGHEWFEWVGLKTEVYYPRGHERAGEAFTIGSCS